MNLRADKPPDQETEFRAVLHARRLIQQAANPEAHLTAEGRFVLHCTYNRISERAGALAGDLFRIADYLGLKVLERTQR